MNTINKLAFFICAIIISNQLLASYITFEPVGNEKRQFSIAISAEGNSWIMNNLGKMRN